MDGGELALDGGELVLVPTLLSTHAGVELQCLASDRRDAPLEDSSFAGARADARDAPRAQVRVPQKAPSGEAAQVSS